MTRPSFVRELFMGRVDGTDVFPFPLLGTGRFQQLQEVFAQLRHASPTAARADEVLTSLGLLGKVD